MPGTVTSTIKYFVIAWAAAGIGLAAASSDFFPLQPGNTWVYRQSGRNLPSETWTLSVGPTATLGGHTYTSLHGFPGGDLWVRQDGQGVMWSWAPAKKKEGVWARFGDAPGTRYPTGFTICTGDAQVAKPEKYMGPAGTFDNAFTVSYNPTCADAGIGSETFVRGIGLVRRTSSSFAGPRTLELVYARIGSQTYGRKEENHSVTLKLGTPDHNANVITATLTLKNTTGAPLKLQMGGQQYDFVLLDSSGQEIWRWSKGRMFPMYLRYITLAPGEEKSWTDTVRLLTQDGSGPLPRGRYTIKGVVATPPRDQYRAEAVLEW